MRRITGWILSGCAAFVLVVPAAADDASEARALLEKAIQAAGGEQNLKKHVANTFKETGTYYGMGEGLPYTGSYAVQFPGKFRMEIEGVFTMVLNVDKGWIHVNGETRELAAEELKLHKGNHYVGWLNTLVPLKDKQFKLAKAAAVKIDGRPATGIRVSAEDQPDVTMYFDDETKLLVKTENRAFAAELGKEVQQEILLSNHKEVDGAKVAMKFLMKRDGQKFVEAEVHDYVAVEKLDDNVFAKP